MHTHALRSLVYVSRATRVFADDDLRALQHQAATANARLRVTGYLCHDRGRFLQYIEGPEASLDDLFQRIQHDGRHEVLASLDDPAIRKRRFDGWDMRWITASELLEISLEHLLTDRLLLIGRMRNADQAWRDLTWAMVRKLSEQRRRLSPGVGLGVASQRAGGVGRGGADPRGGTPTPDGRTGFGGSAGV